MARRERAPTSAPVSPPFTLSASLAALALLGSSPGAQSACGYALEYGMNPSFHTWWSRAIVLADALARSHEFVFWDNGPQGRAPVIPLGSGRPGEGWPDPAALAPGERFGTMLFGSMEGTVPDGRELPYVVTWQGSGHVQLEGIYVAGERNRAPNRVEVFVDPTRGPGDKLLVCSWTAADADDPVRDVHVWLPGMAEMEGADAIFWPPFLAKARQLNAGRGPHTWRTLDWTRVNDYGRPPALGGFVFDLAGVITPQSPSQGTSRGVAAEYQVAFCNALRSNLHFQVPHRTDDLSEADYVRFVEQQLRVIRDGSPGMPGLFGGRPFAGLDPGLTVTLELSNEIWNSGFPVHTWMKEEAQRHGVSFHAAIAREIQLVFDVADAVFAGADAPRLRKFVAGFVADPSYLERVLSFLRPGTRVDAVGPAAYVAPRSADIDAWLLGATPTSCPNCPDAEELLAAAERAVEALRPLLAHHRAVTLGYTNPDGSHPELVLYEAGQNMKSSGRPWAPAAREVQLRPELFELFVERYVPMLIDAGVTLVNWYSFMTDQDSPTLDAFGVWNDMNQTLELPIVLPYVPASAPKAAVVCLGPPLSAACPRARATVRNAPGNVTSYSTSAPILGSWFNARVDLALTGHASAFVVGSLTPLSLSLPGGGTLLTALTGAEFLPLTNGPIATWSVPIPNDPALAGVPIATQAFHVGGGAGITLSNAVDLEFGRP